MAAITFGAGNVSYTFAYTQTGHNKYVNLWAVNRTYPGINNVRAKVFASTIFFFTEFSDISSNTVPLSTEMMNTLGAVKTTFANPKNGYTDLRFLYNTTYKSIKSVTTNSGQWSVTYNDNVESFPSPLSHDVYLTNLSVDEIVAALGSPSSEYLKTYQYKNTYNSDIIVLNHYYQEISSWYAVIKYDDLEFYFDSISQNAWPITLDNSVWTNIHNNGHDREIDTNYWSAYIDSANANDGTASASQSKCLVVPIQQTQLDASRKIIKGVPSSYAAYYKAEYANSTFSSAQVLQASSSYKPACKIIFSPDTFSGAASPTAQTLFDKAFSAYESKHIPFSPADVAGANLIHFYYKNNYNCYTHIIDIAVPAKTGDWSLFDCVRYISGAFDPYNTNFKNECTVVVDNNFITTPSCYADAWPAISGYELFDGEQYVPNVFNNSKPNYEEEWGAYLFTDVDGPTELHYISILDNRALPLTTIKNNPNAKTNLLLHGPANTLFDVDSYPNAFASAYTNLDPNILFSSTINNNNMILFNPTLDAYGLMNLDYKARFVRLVYVSNSSSAPKKILVKIEMQN